MRNFGIFPAFAPVEPVARITDIVGSNFRFSHYFELSSRCYWRNDTKRDDTHDTRIGRRKLWSKLHGGEPFIPGESLRLRPDTGARNGPLGLAMAC